MESGKVEKLIKRIAAISTLPLVQVEDNQITIAIDDLELAREIWELWREFPDLFIELRVEGENYLHSPHPKNSRTTMINQTTNQRSCWLQENLTIAQILQDQGSYSLHSLDRDNGFLCLDIAPFKGLTEVLFSPDLNDFIGKPADFSLDAPHLHEMARRENKSSPEIIGKAKDKVIRDALDSPLKTASVDYEFFWSGDYWPMRYTASIVGNEALLFATNEKSRQREYWLDMAARSQS